MAFTSEIGYINSGVLGQNVGRGSLRMHFGTWANDGGSTGGDIDTGLAQCYYIKLNIKGASVSATIPVVNETFPCGGSAITIVTPANASGTWEAFGF